jgi:hypothetical protein
MHISLENFISLIKICTPLLIVFFAPVIADAQKKDVLMDMALKHFDNTKNQKVWWLKDMTGFLDHTHEIRMVLATDNETFKGAYEVLSSRQRYYLDGNHDGEQIVLTETDSSGITTGVVRGDMNDDKFYCQWSDLKNTEQLDLFLFTKPPTQNPCGNIGWIKSYNVNKDSIRSIIVYKKEDVVKIIVKKLNHNKEYIMECQDDACTQMIYYGSAFENESELQLDLESKNLTIKTLSNIIKYKIYEENVMYFDCRSYMDFERKFSYIYALTNDKNFNEFISYNFIDKYMSPDTKKKKVDVVSKHDRFAHIEYGDIEIDIYNDTLISGLFLFQSSKHHEVTEIPFTYFFKKKKSFEIKDFYIESFNFEKSIEAKVKEIKKKNKSISDPFEKSEYPIITFTDNGYLCRTKFSTIYGRDEILIPYKEFNSYYKKKPLYKF